MAANNLKVVLAHGAWAEGDETAVSPDGYSLDNFYPARPGRRRRAARSVRGLQEQHRTRIGHLLALRETSTGRAMPLPSLVKRHMLVRPRWYACHASSEAGGISSARLRSMT